MRHYLFILLHILVRTHPSYELNTIKRDVDGESDLDEKARGNQSNEDHI